MGGVILKGSDKVFVSHRAAARKDDPLACDRQPVPKGVLESLVRETSLGAKLGAEWKQIGVQKLKSAANLVDGKVIASAARIDVVDVEGAAGSLKATVDVLKGELRGSLGEADNLRGKTRYGVEIGGAVALLEGKAVYRSPLFRLPLTNWGVGIEAEGALGLGALEAKAEAGLIIENGSYTFTARERLGAGVAESIKVAFVLKEIKAPAPDIPIDRVSEGSSNVFIGD